MISSTPRAFKSIGTAIPPLLFTASTAILNFRLEIAALSTSGIARIASMCFLIESGSGVTLPSLFTSLNSILPESAIRRISSPSAALTNSPL
ncbi:MAG: hypothetical protein BWY67_00160 [Bacteroidetes bacterium ADurb.Bin397]|nr:MAG: hypothetical protein BWY67_00160 [Bacteroidetes bacterium ADurb.Bin397]